MQYHRGYHGGRADDPHGVTAPRQGQMFDPTVGKKTPDYGRSIGENGSKNPGAPTYRRGGGNGDWQNPEPDMGGGSMVPARPKAPASGGGAYASMSA